ncbi:MAG: universal stress protein [Frankiales bacterium]|nr:universal stress protein [Frankiales bacterium]
MVHTSTWKRAVAGEESSVGSPADGSAAGVVVAVGVDGSASSVTALRYAVEEARHRGGRLRVIGVYPYDDAGLEAQRETKAVEAALAEVGLAADVAAGRVEVVLVQGRPGAALAEASAGAALLVVGAEAHSLLGRLVKGSVLPGLVQHVRVPTLVVPTGWSPQER